VKKISIYLMAASFIIMLISFIGSKGEMIENMEIPLGVGADIEKTDSFVEYKIPLLVYTSDQSNKMTGGIFTGTGRTIGKTREERQLKSGKRFILGLNRVFIFSEGNAKHGLRNLIDANLNNPDVNDRSMCVVCKGKAEDILKYKVQGYPSSPEYIWGMVKNLNQFNFFSSQYTFTDMVVRIDAEGRNLLLPYIEITDDGIKTTGLAVFKKDKMVAKTNIKEARVINILKENNVKGIFTIQRNPAKYTDLYVDSKRKIKCSREDDRYKFEITLNLRGRVTNNELYEGLSKDPKALKAYEDDVKESVEKQCNEIINKVKNEYKVDVLDLGRVAAAKFGRGKGTDWDEEISNSEIIVKAKVKVDTEGRGNY
jgi:spore germination protein